MCDAIFAARQRELRPIVTSRYPSRTCPSAYITSYQPRRSNDLVSWEMQRVRGKLMCHALCHALRINRTGKNLAHGDQRIGKVSFNTPNPNLGLRGPSAQSEWKPYFKTPRPPKSTCCGCWGSPTMMISSPNGSIDPYGEAPSTII